MMGKRFQSIVTNFESLELRRSEVLEDEEEKQKRARKGKAHAYSPPLRKKKKAQESNARMDSYGSMEGLITMGKIFQFNVSTKRLASLSVELKILASITLRAPGSDERSCNMQGDEVVVYVDAIYSGFRLPF